MKDQRVDYFRKLLASLIESLEAEVRIKRWEGPDAVPDPLKKSAAELMQRLSAANRLASDKFVGSTAVVAALTAMSTAARRLDAAYVESRKNAGGPGSADESMRTLSDEIDAVKADAAGWEK
jgi:hypothetical protein